MKFLLNLCICFFIFSSCGDPNGDPNGGQQYNNCVEGGVCQIKPKVILAPSGLAGIGGVSGADSSCDSGFKALIAVPGVRGDCAADDCSSATDWPLLPSTKYYNGADEFAGTTNENKVFTFPLSNPLSTGGSAFNISNRVYTGLNNDWTNGENCQNFTSNDSGDSITYGETFYLESPSVPRAALSMNALSHDTGGCNEHIESALSNGIAGYILCVQQPDGGSADESEGLSSACEAINNLANINLSGFSESEIVSVGELSDNEVLNIEYTLTDPAGGEQLIIRWLTDAEDEIDPKVADVTASGTTEDATQPENAAKLRAYVVSGNWEIDYSCSLSE